MRLELRNVTKRYGKTLALSNLNLTVASGEILGIAGPNGAGKSTIIKILAGEEDADSGDMLLDGARWSPEDKECKVAVVHQEPLLYPNLTVAENLLIGKEGRKKFLKPVLEPKEREMLLQLGILSYADRELGSCPLLVRQLCEISRALLADAKVFLFDEPNSALTEQESEQLFLQMRVLRDAGHLVILVTHRLKEMVENTDRVMVIRDGVNFCVVEGDELTEEILAERLVVDKKVFSTMAGTKFGTREPGISSRSDDVLIDVSGFTHRYGAFSSVDLKVMRGEVLAIMGVEGSGAREILRAISGLEPAYGMATAQGGSANASFNDIEYLAASRQVTLYQNRTISDNLNVRLGYPDIAYRSGYLMFNAMLNKASESLSKFRIRAASPQLAIGSLSGGNQQKVAVAAAIAKRPVILALEEPTRGVDIQSKAEIYSFIREFACAGNAVLVFCTEALEVFELADRVAIVTRGRLSSYLDVSLFNSVEELASNIARVEGDASRNNSKLRQCLD